MFRTAPISQKQNTLDQPPNALELWFVIHSIKGPQFSDQSACVSINEHSFVLSPRDIKFCERIYESGFSLYIPADEYVRFSVGVVTFQDNDLSKQNKRNHTGYLHSFAQFKSPPVSNPTVKKLSMETFGGSYVINATLYIAPSNKCKSPIPSKSPQVYKNRQKSNSQNRNRNVRAQTQLARYQKTTQPKTANNRHGGSKETHSKVKPQSKEQETPFVTDNVNQVFEVISPEKKE